MTLTFTFKIIKKVEHDSIISRGDSFNESEKPGLLKVPTLTHAFKPMNSIQIDKTPDFGDRKNQSRPKC